MPIIDVQVHPFDRNHPGRPWASPSHGLDSATGEEMVAAMNSVGVDGAIMVSSFSAYEYDPSYALEVYNTYPDKFRVVTPVDATDPAIDDVVAKSATTPGARGIRIRMRDGLPMDADHPGLNRAFAAAAKHGLPSDTARRSSLSTISACCSLLARRSPPTSGLLSPNCSPWPSTTTCG
jgi:predicted TIM-barrel fold metal-dependent hydrolase